jgi:stearoyl-CoA desaturase (delta-9 desaturase)
MPHELSEGASPTADHRIAWPESVPFFLIHGLPLLAIFTGIRWRDVLLCVALYYIRMFFITAGYHRYFAHRSYRLNRVMQFLVAAGGSTAAQKGVLWWAGWHRDHHRYADTPKDIHTPRDGFLWSHFGWFLARKYDRTPVELIKDFSKYPELRWLNDWHLVPPTLLGVAVFWLGGWSALFIGFFLSTVLLWHGTFTINSLAHVFGRRRYATDDDSRNSLLLSLITNGEGWHNNHHHYQASVRQGFFWWEIDVSFYLIKAMSWMGMARDLRKPPPQVLRDTAVSPGRGERPAVGSGGAPGAP